MNFWSLWIVLNRVQSIISGRDLRRMKKLQKNSSEKGWEHDWSRSISNFKIFQDIRVILEYSKVLQDNFNVFRGTLIYFSDFKIFRDAQKYFTKVFKIVNCSRFIINNQLVIRLYKGKKKQTKIPACCLQISKFFVHFIRFSIYSEF